MDKFKIPLDIEEDA
jgi:P27 family predicted phage terminase small subunit